MKFQPIGTKDDWGTRKFTLSIGVKDDGDGERWTKITTHHFQAPAP